MSCSAYGCTNRSARKGAEQLEVEKQKKITFHKFPKDLEKRQQWIKAVRRDNWEPSARSVSCSSHFADECFDRTSLCYVRLWENAFPPYLQKVLYQLLFLYLCVEIASFTILLQQFGQLKSIFCLYDPTYRYKKLFHATKQKKFLMATIEIVIVWKNVILLYRERFCDPGDERHELTDNVGRCTLMINFSISEAYQSKNH